MASNEVYNPCMSGMTPAEIAECFKNLCPEFGDLNGEGVLLVQESCLQHIQNNIQKRDLTSASSETSPRGSVWVNDGESSNRASIEYQLALDEALARALEDDMNDFYTEEHTTSTVENWSSTSTETPGHLVENQDAREGEIDPDRMTYEELQSLGEAVGTESRGLPAYLMDRLPKFKYKDGFFSKRKEKEQCVICFADYVKGVKLIALPCAHRYHSECIKKWLKDNKNCPVCLKEVEI